MDGEMAAAIIGAIIGWLLGLFSKDVADCITVLIRGPKLVVEFGDGEDFVTLTPEQYVPQKGPNVSATRAETRVVMYARIRITNSKPRIAQNCRAWLVNIEEKVNGEYKATVFRDSVPLIWSYNAEIDTADVPKGVSRYVDVVRIQNDVVGYEPCLRANDGSVLKPLRFQPLFRKYGIFRFSILVSAQDVPPQETRIDVAWDGSWPPKVSMSA